MIKLMYVNGDSFSFGEELTGDTAETRLIFTEYKRRNCYSGIIADTCKIPNYINNSRPGGSNERTYRTLINDIPKLLTTYRPDEIFVNVSLTSPYRLEFSYGDNNEDYYDFMVVHPPPKSYSFLYNLWKIITSRYNHDYGWHNFDIMMQLGIQNFLKVNKIPYLITTSMGNHNDLLVFKQHIDCNLLKQTDNLRFYKEFSFLTFNEIHKLPKGIGHHPLEDGHKAWAAALLTIINDRKLFESEDL
jgi:hypothetical protein